MLVSSIPIFKVDIAFVLLYSVLILCIDDAHFFGIWKYPKWPIGGDFMFGLCHWFAYKVCVSQRRSVAMHKVNLYGHWADTFNRFFFPRAISLWNELPIESREKNTRFTKQQFII